VRRDLEHLKLLAIFHYVKAGLIALGSMLGLLYVALGVTMIVTPLPAPAPGTPGPPPAFPVVMGWFFVVFGGAIVVIGSTIAILVLIAGRCLARRRRWTYSFVVACILCANMPLGTVLGIFTILVLLRPTVKDLFEGKIVLGDPEEDEEEYRDALPVEMPEGEQGNGRIYARRREYP
jgi:hypothetical protein